MIPSTCRHTSSLSLAHVLRSALLLSATMLAAGCYSHVVREEGIGVGATEIYEPNVEVNTDKDPWNRVSAGTNRGVKNWKSSGTPAKPKSSSGSSSGFGD